MLSRLQDSDLFGFPWATTLFFSGCVIVSLATTIEPSLAHWLGGRFPREHSWLLFTAALNHGFANVPGLVHLALMTLIIWLVGPLTERLIGTAPATAIFIVSLAVDHLLQITTGDTANGSSAVIWVCGPIIWLALRRTKRRAGPLATRDLVYERSRGMLFLMYVIVPLVMAALPYTMGEKPSFLSALIDGNRFHIAATLIGVAATFVWRKRITRRVEMAASVRIEAVKTSIADRLAIAFWFALDLFLVVIIVVAARSK